MSSFCKTRYGSIAQHTGGSVAIIFALTAFLLFGFVGGAIDFARIYRAQSAFQGGLDGAVLAAARAKQTGSSDDEAIKIAQAYLDPVKKRINVDGNIEITVTGGGSGILAVGNLSQPSMFLNVIGIDKLKFKTVATSNFGIGTAGKSNVELVMMLDVTGSMAGQKIVDLQAAAQDLIDIVVSDDQSGSTSRIGLVPFSNAVKLPKSMFETATGTGSNQGPGGGNAYKGCVVEREGPDAYTDAAPAVGSLLTPLEEKAVGAPCADAREVFPMSDKKSDLKKIVRDLTVGGSTAGHLGTAWAWYLLSPHWAALFDSKSEPGPYRDLTEKLSTGEPKLKKIAVLMTDGAYNTQYSAVDSTTQARALCAEMKASGIVVYTVGFQLAGDPTATATLQGCASDDSKFYDATTGDALKAAFRDIALKSAPLRLTQ
jgi:Flp pilus assembly protein TadG